MAWSNYPLIYNAQITMPPVPDQSSVPQSTVKIMHMPSNQEETYGLRGTGILTTECDRSTVFDLTFIGCEFRPGYGTEYSWVRTNNSFRHVFYSRSTYYPY